jgi:hypothetical protein
MTIIMTPLDIFKDPNDSSHHINIVKTSKQVEEPYPSEIM